MTQDEIIEMAKEAGLEVDGVYFSDAMYREVLVRFAKLVAAKEREALAQKQEVGYWKEHAQGLQRDYDLLLADYEKLAQQEQEPVAWRVKVETKLRNGLVDVGYQVRSEKLSKHDEPLYTHPLQRTWVGLTDEDIYNLEGFYDFMTKEEFFDAIRGVEAKLKEKNT